jgi:protoheme IX farnesyltransferase
MSIDTAPPPPALPLSPPRLGAACDRPDSQSDSDAGRLAAFVSLTKPRITLMVLLTVAVGFLLGSRGAAHPIELALTVLGTGLVAAGASVWNQVLERRRDARMRRTANRPLPRGIITPGEASLFGSILAVGGTLLLALGANTLSAEVALATFVLYVGLYTPLKPYTTLNTAIGAVPGALPPVIGWAAATGRLGIEAWALFLILFLWQFPHFLAIAWLYRDDYARGGHRMLPSVDPTGALTGRQAAGYALALIPAGLLPAVVGVAGPLYFTGALALGLGYFAAALRFWGDVGEDSARRLLRTSFLHLPGVLMLLLLNPLPA